MAKKRITDVPRNGSDADFVPENYMLIDGAEGSAKMRMNLFGKASTIEELDEVKYEKPEGGIPKSDLDSSVQTSLVKADSALQQHQSLDGYVNNIQTDSTTIFSDSSTIVVGKSGKNILTRTALSLYNYLNGKFASVYAALNHTHFVKINGNTKTIDASGGTAVDLGTYLTSHQDISGKANTNGSNASGTWPISVTGNAASATNSTNATYASKIGSSSSPQGIGSTSQPVYVETDGSVKPCTGMSGVRFLKRPSGTQGVKYTVTSTDVQNGYADIPVNFTNGPSLYNSLIMYKMERIEVISGSMSFGSRGVYKIEIHSGDVGGKLVETEEVSKGGLGVGGNLFWCFFDNPDPDKLTIRMFFDDTATTYFRIQEGYLFNIFLQVWTF